MKVNLPGAAARDHMPQQVCALIQALAHPDRLRLALLLLRDGARPVGALARGLGASAPTTSRALAVLRDAGVAIAQRRGRRMVYRLADARIECFVAAIADEFTLDNSRR